jgi:2-polyprenyl-6-hydroxyphenyl methylase/3-demethylubiquinone-9 3-methyltransferase
MRALGDGHSGNLVTRNETALSTHFRFGENWQSFQARVDEAGIAEAVRGLEKLVSDLSGKRFLDVGCGSGLSMLAALQLGASSVVGTDMDPDSVAASRNLLSRSARGKDWQVLERSVLDMGGAELGTFDVVYSWGVLHHTADMWTALAKAGLLVKSNGLLVVALYHKTPLCTFWRKEKRFYTHAHPWQQKMIRIIYKGAFLLRLFTIGQTPRRYVAEYHMGRGMDWHHDVHDWLGGYPYESTLPREVVPKLREAGFVVEKIFERRVGRMGIFGSGCDEYVARRSG